MVAQTQNSYLKIPIEFAEFALRERQISKAGIYLATQFIYSGKAPIEKTTVLKIGTACDLKPRTIYSAFKWLIDRDWMGKDSANGWYFFRSINHIHQIEDWKYSRSALMFEKDLQSARAFFIGAFLASVCRSGNMGSGTERQSRRSVRTPYPVSLSFIEQALKVSTKTAYNYRNEAQSFKYIRMYQNLKTVSGISRSDVIQMRHNKINKVTVPLFGSPMQTITVKPEQLIFEQGIVFAQMPNLIKPLILMGKRNLRSFKQSKPILPTVVVSK